MPEFTIIFENEMICFVLCLMLAVQVIQTRSVTLINDFVQKVKINWAN